MKKKTRPTKSNSKSSKKTKKQVPAVGGQPENDKDAREAGMHSATSNS